MHYIRIKGHIIYLDDICYVEPVYPGLVIHFKSVKPLTICFDDADSRIDAVNQIWNALTNMRQ